MPVGGVNKYLKLKNKNHHHKNKKHQAYAQGEGGPNLPVGNTEVADRNFDRGKEDQAAWYAKQEQQKAAILLKQKQIAEERQREEFKAATFKRQYNPFDGLIHSDDGRTWDLEGQEVLLKAKKTEADQHAFAQGDGEQYPIYAPKLPIGNTEVSDRNFVRDKEDKAAWWEQQEKTKAAILKKQK